MNNIKRYLLCILVGIIIGSTTIVIAYSVTSNEVSYAPENSNWEVANVEDAVNDLYEYSRADTLSKLSFDTNLNFSYGYRLIGRNTSLTLEKGNYIIIGYSASNSSHTSFEQRVSDGSVFTLDHSSGECTQLFVKSVSASGSKPYYQTTHYMRVVTYVIGWQCSFPDNATINLSTTIGSAAEDYGEVLYINSIKLN